MELEVATMPLDAEIQSARQDIVSDGYDMSVGEIINLYRDGELIIDPAYQRLFRWDETRKTRFIESLLLGIPIPPIFVYQDEKGVWELIDGVQRLSTVFQFAGVLRGVDDQTVPLLVLEGTQLLPSLAEKQWESPEGQEDRGIGHTQQLQIKRARLRVEILKQESSPEAKYELFQRLNTGGASLSEQEVRNCIASMVNRQFQAWLSELSRNEQFSRTIDQTDAARLRQADEEHVLRYLAYCYVDYQKGLDVHEYLDQALMVMAKDQNFDYEGRADRFRRTFALIDTSMGDEAFKRWDGAAFGGKFLISVFEVVATGISLNLEAIEAKPNNTEFIRQKCKDLWTNRNFTLNSGAGVRGTTRLANLLPMAEQYFKP